MVCWVELPVVDMFEKADSRPLGCIYELGRCGGAERLGAVSAWIHELSTGGGAKKLMSL